MAAGWKALAALVVTVVIWASFLVVTRVAVTSSIGVVEVGLIRYGTGALLFLPVLVRQGFLPGDGRFRDILVVSFFGGMCFVLFLGVGLQVAPVADSGVFTPGMLPFYVALLSLVFLGERFTPLRSIGFALIVLGALSVGMWEAIVTGAPGVWRGHLCFTAASLSWAIYTVVFRRSGLSPIHGGALMCLWSTVGLGLLGLVRGVDFAGIPFEALAVQVVFQGVLSGFVATFTFFYAVTHIGASRTAACAALVPVLAALGGWAFLGESIGVGKGLGIVVVSVGVALASGAFTPQKRLVENGRHR